MIPTASEDEPFGIPHNDVSMNPGEGETMHWLVVPPFTYIEENEFPFGAKRDKMRMTSCDCPRSGDCGEGCSARSVQVIADENTNSQQALKLNTELGTWIFFFFFFFLSTSNMPACVLIHMHT